MDRILHMEDIGTRIEHLNDLHKLWSDGLAIMLQGSYHNEYELELIKDIEVCLKHLENHMSKDYDHTPYAKEINRIGFTPPEDKQ